MIMGSSDDNLAGPGVEGDPDVVTLVQGRVHLTIFSSSLFVALRVVFSDHKPEARESRALLAYVPTPAAKEILMGFVAWGGITSTPEYHAPPYWELGRAMKTVASQAALVVLREVFMSLLRSVISQRDVGNRTIDAPCDSSLISEYGTIHIPRIIVTPPDDDSSASLNAVPAPQDAAFGNKLVVPDPEFKVVNRRSPENPFSDDFRADGSSPEPFTRADGEVYNEGTEDSEVCHGIIGSLDDEDDEDVTALGLGPTWSG